MSRLLNRIAFAALLALTGCCCGPGVLVEHGGGEDDAAMDPSPDDPPPDDPPPDDPAPAPRTAWFDSPRADANIFASGHSLLDRVFGWSRVDGGPIAEIARNAGKTHHSLLQEGAGSTARLRHQDIEAGRYPRPDWAPFDTMVITERADLVDVIIFEESVRELGWFTEQIIGAPPGGDELFFYQTWWGFNDGGRIDLDTWDEWAAHVRAELPLAECLSERVGRDHEVRMRVLPAGNALAVLMLRIQAGDADGLQPSDIFAEDFVHLSDVGHVYLSMVVFSAVYRTPTRGVTIPGVSASRAALFSELADAFVSDYYDSYEAPSSATCRAAMTEMCRRAGVGMCNPEETFSDALYGAPVGD